MFDIWATPVRRLQVQARPLPMALAHCFATTKLGNAKRMELLNRVYLQLSPADQLRCKGELRLCRAAKREQVQATVS